MTMSQWLGWITMSSIGDDDQRVEFPAWRNCSVPNWRIAWAWKA